MIEARKRVGMFLISLLQTSTQGRYSGGAQAFFDWADEHNVALTDLEHAEFLDCIVADWILELREDEEHAPQYAADAIAGLQKFFPHSRLKASWQVLQGRRSEYPINSALPFGASMVYSCALLLCAAGRHHIGVLALTVWSGVMRIGEGIDLLASGVVLPQSGGH